jgi:hypothetical protein
MLTQGLAMPILCIWDHVSPPFFVGDVICLPFIQEMRGAGQAAGRQSRVAASPSSSTWSLSLIWKTGGKSGGGAKTAIYVWDSGHLLLREGQVCMNPGMWGVKHHATPSRLFLKCETYLSPGPQHVLELSFFLHQAVKMLGRYFMFINHLEQRLALKMSSISIVKNKPILKTINS